MNMIMRKLLLLFLFIVTNSLKAEIVFIDGVFYFLNPETKEASVECDPLIYTTPSNMFLYDGDITIPSVIVNDGTTYDVTKIGESAFVNSVNLHSVVLPNSIRRIGGGAFGGCKGLVSISIPPSVKTIGANAFGFCKSLEAVHITDLEAWCKIEFEDFIENSYFMEPGNPLYHAHHLLLNGSEIENLTIPNTISKINKYAFIGCNIKTLDIHDGVDIVGDVAFSSCANLTSVSLPKAVTTIGNAAFSECTSLLSLSIPNSVVSLGSSALAHCSALNSVSISENIKRIDDLTFEGCTSLASIKIPSEVESIGRGAFMSCTRLESISFSNKLKIIEGGAFNSCTSLLAIQFPEGVEEFGNYVLQNCTNLMKVIIPSSIKAIGEKAFSGCPGLVEVQCSAKGVPSTSWDAFNSDYIVTSTLYVPDESIERYKEEEPWKHFGTIKGLSETPTGINNLINSKQKNDKIYNLKGEVINNKEKGIFIYNGKKYVRN